jgi:hypothetical protein
MNQEYGQKEIKNKKTSATSHIKGHPGFIVSQDKISSYRGYSHQYRQAGKDAYEYLFFHGYNCFTSILREWG